MPTVRNDAIHLRANTRTYSVIDSLATNQGPRIGTLLTVLQVGEK